MVLFHFIIYEFLPIIIKCEMNWIEILLIFVILSGYNYSSLTATVRGNSDGKCMANLMNVLADEAFSSSSFQDNFYAHQARVIFDKTNSNNSSSLAWCPKGNIEPEPTEWIQVSFDSLKMISNIFTYGRDNGNFGFFVPAYHFDYQRENGSLWHRYRNLDGTTIIPGNSDSRNSQVKLFSSNIVAKRVRIIPISEIGTRVCLKFSLYGCDFNDGVVEYSISQGNTLTDSSDQKYRLIDRTYDTISKQPMWVPGTILHGGIGQIMDNQINTESIQTTKENEFNFVGWHLNNTRSPVQMLFRFDKIREILSVRFHVLNNFKDKISIFASAKFEFSINGEIFGKISKDITVSHEVDSHVMKARWVKVYLNNSIAKYLRVTLFFHLEWIVITEVEFETNLINPINIAERTKFDIMTTSSVLINGKEFIGTNKMNYFLTLFGGLVALILILIVTIFFVLRIRRHRKRRFKGKSNQSMLYGNMPCNNVIPIPLTSGNNGGFYKPVPSGVYDCMLPYQAQTMNVRKVPGFNSQNSQQLFGTFNNRNNGSANANNIVNVMSKDNYNAVLSPIVGQQAFNQNINTHFSENKRSSFDGSYAGTGSNAEYSNVSVNRESISLENSFHPMHLRTVPPVMFGQFTNQNNEHQMVQMQGSVSYSLPYTTDNHQIDPMNWSEEFMEIIVKHSRHDAILQSPVGGSMIIRQSTIISETPSYGNYEKEICNTLLSIDRTQIVIQSIIGSGKYGTIYKGVYNGSTVVVKSIDRKCILSGRVLFLRTVSDLLKLSNKNTASIIGYSTYDNQESHKDCSNQAILPIINSIIIEDSQYTDIHTFIRTFSKTSKEIQNIDLVVDSNSLEDDDKNCRNKSFLSSSCLIYIASQISNGMSYFERENLVHRDLAARNCLLGPRLSIRITDTALTNNQFQDDYLSLNDVSNDLSQTALIVSTVDHHVNIKLPLCWMSWEAALKADYSIKSDVWSFGVVLWEIFTNCQFHPYFTVPDILNNFESFNIKHVECISLIYNFKYLQQSSEKALLPNNESLAQIHQTSNWLSQIPLSAPKFLTDLHSLNSTKTLINVNNRVKNSANHILNTNREMRDLIESCWSIDPSLRPNFKDINMFLDQKLNGFNAQEEYEILQVKISEDIEEPFDDV